MLVADECYLSWLGVEAVSVLHSDVCDGTHAGLLPVHSLSKRSNLAGYRCRFVAGDPAIVGELLAVRKHVGMIVPAPQQAAMVAALADDSHVPTSIPATRPAARSCGQGADARGLQDQALRGVPVPVGHPRRGLLDHGRLARRASASWSPPARSMAGRPPRHVRVALTATDERVEAAAARLATALVQRSMRPPGPGIFSIDLGRGGRHGVSFPSADSGSGGRPSRYSGAGGGYRDCGARPQQGVGQREGVGRAGSRRDTGQVHRCGEAQARRSEGKAPAAPREWLEEPRQDEDDVGRPLQPRCCARRRRPVRVHRVVRLPWLTNSAHSRTVTVTSYQWTNVNNIIEPGSVNVPRSTPPASTVSTTRTRSGSTPTPRAIRTAASSRWL